MAFGADIDDDEIGRRRRVIDAAVKPLRDPPVAIPRPRRETLLKNFRRRRDRYHP
jgi:hypothetical protein